VAVEGDDAVEDNADTSRLQPQRQSEQGDTGQQWPPSSWPSSS
jgi:hypothetical protein